MQKHKTHTKMRERERETFHCNPPPSLPVLNECQDLVYVDDVNVVVVAVIFVVVVVVP